MERLHHRTSPHPLLIAAVSTFFWSCSLTATAESSAIGLSMASQALTSLERGKGSITSDNLRSRADDCFKRGEVKQAIAAYRSAIVANSRDARNYYGLAVALDAVGALGEERDALKRISQLDASFAPAHNQLGLLDMKEKKINAAETELEAALSLDPHYAEAKNNLGVLIWHSGQNARAEKLLRQAIADNAGYVQAMVNLGSLEASQEHFAEADAVLKQALAIAPLDLDALTEDAMVLIKLDRNSDAVVAFRKAVEIAPKGAEAHVNLGIALATIADLDGALSEFTEALNLDPKEGIAHYNRGRVLADMRRYPEAKNELETAVRLNANNAEWWSTLADMTRTTGDTEESIHGYRVAAELDPKSAKRHFDLGQALQSAGDTKSAIAQWRESLTLEPTHRAALYALSRALIRTQPEEAKQLQARIAELISLETASDESKAIGNDALAAATAKDWPRAIAQLHAAIERCGECDAKPLLHKNLGLVYCQSGDLKHGESELLEAKKLLPRDGDVAKALEILRSRSK